MAQSLPKARAGWIRWGERPHERAWLTAPQRAAFDALMREREDPAGRRAWVARSSRILDRKLCISTVIVRNLARLGLVETLLREVNGPVEVFARARARHAWKLLQPEREHNARQTEGRRLPVANEPCHSAKDGECEWAHCPQIRDGEPDKSGRHCPLDLAWNEED